MAASDIRDELRDLGERRKNQEEDAAVLANDVEKALKKAYGRLSVSEAARLLGMHRTTVYRVYGPHSHSG